MKNTRILVCEDSIEGILTAVHEAYTSRYGLHDIRVVTKEPEPEFFTEIEYVQTNMVHAASVAEAITRKISKEAREVFMKAACAADGEKAQHLYRFLVCGFYMGAAVLQYQSEPSVRYVSRLCKMVERENDKLKGFLRFYELPNQVLFARIRPKHRQLELLQAHFGNRYPNENFMICDVGRRIACVHQKHQESQLIGYEYLSQLLPAEEAMLENQDIYEGLWKAFFDATYIPQRKNTVLQSSMMAKRFWEFAPEMQNVTKIS